MRVLIAILLLAAGPATAAGPKACEGAEHRQFDFWVGEWRVTTPDGKHAGDNTIEKVLDGCALHERWRGASGFRGFSYNAWDKDRKVWHQTWVDQQGSLLLLEGRFTAGQMVLNGTLGPAQQRITWEPRKDGTVRQHWQSSVDQGKTWKTEFDGLYRRKDPSP